MKRKVGKYRFTFTDAAILLFAVVLAVRYIPAGQKAQDNTNGELYYTLTLYGADVEAENGISPSEQVTDADGNILGTVQQVISKEASVGLTDPETGERVMGYDYTKRDIDIKIFSRANLSERGYTVGDTSICVGETYSIQTPDFYAVGVCTSLQTRSEEVE